MYYMKRMFACLLALGCSMAPARASESTHDELIYQVSCLAHIGRCGFPAFSPDEKTIAFVSSMSGTPQLWTVPIEGGWPTQITALDDTVIGEEWSPKSNWLSLLTQAGGVDRPFYAIRSDGLSLKLMSEGTKYCNLLAGWSPDGKQILLSSDRTTPKEMKCFLADPQSGQLKPLAPKSVSGVVEDVSSDNRWAVVLRCAGNSGNLYRIDTTTGAEQLLTPHTDATMFTGGSLNRSRVRLSPDGSTVYFLTNKDRHTDEHVFARIKIADNGIPGPIEVLSAPNGKRCMGFSIDRSFDHAAVAWENSMCSFELMDLHTGTCSPLADPPGDECFEMEISPKGDLIAFQLNSASTPEDIWLFDTHQGTYRQLTFSPHPGVALDSLVRPEEVKFSGRDGKELKGWLYRPKNQTETKAAPYVVMFSGGNYFDTCIQSLLSQGIGVFCPKIREVTLFHDKDVNAIVKGTAIQDETDDIKSSVDYLVANKLADPSRIGVFGQSHGGRLAILGATEYPDLFQACEEDYGIMNYFTYRKELRPEAAAMKHLVGVDPQTEAAVMHRLSVV